MKLFKKGNRELKVIAIAAVVIITLLIIKLLHYHDFIPDWDENYHLTLGFLFFNALKTHNMNYFFQLFMNPGYIYPPFHYVVMGISYLVFGITPNAGIYANIPYIPVLMFSIYGLGLVLGNKKAGLAAAILTPLLPAFITFQEMALLDYASTSVFIASFYLLFKTDGFTNRKYSVFFGVSILIGLLIKWPFVVPAIPFIFYAIESFFSQKTKQRKIFLNILLVIAISLPGLIWYKYNYQNILNTLGFFWNPNAYPQLIWGYPHGFTWQNIGLYLFEYPTQSWGVGIGVLMFFYLSFFLYKRQNKKNYLLASVVITYIVLTYMANKSARYIAYTYPLMMLITLVTLFEIKDKVKRKVLTILFISFILINFFLTQFNYFKYVQVSLNIGNVNIILLPNYYTKYVAGVWPTKTITDNYLNEKNCPKGILVFPDNRFISYFNIKYLLLIRGVTNLTTEADALYNPAKDTTFNSKILNKYSCIITKTGALEEFANPEVMAYVNNYLNSQPEFKRISFKAPDDSLILLYIKK